MEGVAAALAPLQFASSCRSEKPPGGQSLPTNRLTTDGDGTRRDNDARRRVVATLDASMAASSDRNLAVDPLPIMSPDGHGVRALRDRASHAAPREEVHHDRQPAKGYPALPRETRCAGEHVATQPVARLCGAALALIDRRSGR